MTKGAVLVNKLFLVGGVLSLLFYLMQGLTVRFGQSLLYLWLLLGLFLIGRYFVWKRAWAAGKEAPFPRALVIGARVAALVLIALFLFGEYFIVSAGLRRGPDGLDAIVILGAKVNDDGPSGSLRERIETAADYLRRNPGIPAIASGGQGEDEPVSEAACILEGLTAAGIDPERVILEDNSFSTVDNLTNSFALLPENARRIGIVTNDFHVFRALAIGNTLGGYELWGIPARSSVPGFIHYAMREFFAIAELLRRGDIRF